MLILVFAPRLPRLTCLSICLDLVKRCCLLYRDLVSFRVILQPIRALLSRHLTAQTLPDALKVGQRRFVATRPFPRYLRAALCHRSFTGRSWRASTALPRLTLGWSSRRRNPSL